MGIASRLIHCLQGPGPGPIIVSSGIASRLIHWRQGPGPGPRPKAPRRRRPQSRSQSRSRSRRQALRPGMESFVTLYHLIHCWQGPRPGPGPKAPRRRRPNPDPDLDPDLDRDRAIRRFPCYNITSYKSSIRNLSLL